MPKYVTLEKEILKKRYPLSIPVSGNCAFDKKTQEIFLNCSKKIPIQPFDSRKFKGKGIVICGGGKYLASTWVAVRSVRHHGCKLPIEIWHLGKKEVNNCYKKIFEPYGVKFVDALEFSKKNPFRKLNGFELKSYAIMHSSFKEILYIDADNSPTKNVDYLFESRCYKETGAYFFRDKDHVISDCNFYKLNGFDKEKCKIFEIEYINEPSSETGQMIINKQRCWEEVCLATWWNEFSEYTYEHTWFDKDTFVLAWRQNNKPYYITKKHPITGFGLQQFDHNDEVIFLHRCGQKWNFKKNLYLDRPQEYLLHSFVKDLKKKLNQFFLK